MNPVELLRSVLDFLKGQPFSNVVALLQLGLLSGAVWLALFQLVPAERAAILNGMQQQEAQQTKQIEQITKSFERALDRLEDVQADPVPGRSSVAGRE